jgi:bifunctional non-homologous end joining protein LigD
MFVELEGRRIEIKRPEKWVWYEQRYTIMDLVRYYVAVSPWLLRHLERRPIVYETYPGTIKGPNSFEQDPPPGTPRWVKRVKIRGHERIVTYVVVDSAATLVYLASLFMVTLHVWESTTSAIEKPDFLLLDLDPGEDCTIARLGRVAILVRNFLQETGLNEPLVKTSGARGLHVVVPIEPEYHYKAVRTLTNKMAQELSRRYPDEVTAERNAQRRPPAAVYVDWGQMGRGMTIVSPYSPRACNGAPVSMPISWEQVERYALSGSKKPPIDEFARYNISNVAEILKQAGDLWSRQRSQSLQPAMSTF